MRESGHAENIPSTYAGSSDLFSALKRMCAVPFMFVLLLNVPPKGVRTEGFEPSSHGSGPRILPLDDILMVAAPGFEPAQPVYEAGPGTTPDTLR